MKDLPVHKSPEHNETPTATMQKEAYNIGGNVKRRARILLLCDYLPELLDSIIETLDYVGVKDRILLRKRGNYSWQDGNTRVIALPLSVYPEQTRLGLMPVVSIVTYVLLAVVTGIIVVLRNDVNIVVSIYSFPQGLVALVIGKITRRKIAIFTDGGDVDKVMTRHILRPLMLASLKKANLVGALNESKKEKLQHFGIRPYIFPTIGINTTHFDFTSLENRDVNSVLYVGRLSNEKCPEIIVKVCVSLREKHFPVKMTMIGDGPLKQQISSQIDRNGIGNVINLTGHIPHSKMSTYFRNSAIFILPSSSEGVSIALLEAMASGCLCIVSDIPDNLELITHMLNGLTFTLNDDVDLADKIRFATTHLSNLKQLTENARKLVEQKYSIQAIGEALDRLLSII